MKERPELGGEKETLYVREGAEADRQLPDRRGRKADTEPAPDALSAILGLWAKSRQAAHDPIADVRFFANLGEWNTHYLPPFLTAGLRQQPSPNPSNRKLMPVTLGCGRPPTLATSSSRTVRSLPSPGRTLLGCFSPCSTDPSHGCRQIIPAIA